MSEQEGQPPEKTDEAQNNQPPAEEKRPNVRLAHGQQPVTASEDDEGGEVNIGGHGTIKLPSLEAQRAGFYLSEGDLSLLTSQYPRVYVRLTNGGGSQMLEGQQGQPPHSTGEDATPDDETDKTPAATIEDVNRQLRASGLPEIEVIDEAQTDEGGESDGSTPK